MKKLMLNVLHWAHERNLIKGSSSTKQFVKLMEEAGELASGLSKQRKNVVKDSIGDMLVVLVILAEQEGLDIEECLEAAWYEIKDRKGKMIDGIFVKESDL